MQITLFCEAKKVGIYWFASVTDSPMYNNTVHSLDKESAIKGLEKHLLQTIQNQFSSVVTGGRDLSIPSSIVYRYFFKYEE